MPKRRSKAAAETPPVPASPAEAWTRRQKITAGVLALVLIFMDFSVRVRSAVNKSIDFQVMIKMAVWLLAAIWIATNFRRHVLPMLNRVSIPWLILFAWMGVTALYSPTPALTVVSGGSMLLMIFLWLGMAHTLGERRLVEVMFWAMTAFCVASLVLWFVNPGLAQSAIRIHGERILTPRLQGFTGQANALGRTAAFALLLGILYFGTLKRKLNWFVVAPLAVAALVLVLTQSRTSAIACMLAGVYFYALRSRWRWLAPAIIAAVALIGLILAPNFEKIAIAVARTGDPTEIYTATNRIYIWRLVVWLIQQRPLIGWGYNTAATHLAAYSKEVSPELGSYVPPNAHNAYLEVTFAGGVIALLLFMVAAGVNLRSVFKHRHQRGQALMLFWFVTSFTEVAGFTGVVSTSTVTMILPMAIAALAESRLGSKATRRRSLRAAPPPEKKRKVKTMMEPGSATPEEQPPPPKAPVGPVQVQDLG